MRGKPEHQKRVWPLARDDVGKLAVDRRIACRKDMRRAAEVRRSAMVREHLHERGRRIDRRAGEWTEACEQDGKRRSVPICKQT